MPCLRFESILVSLGLVQVRRRNWPIRLLAKYRALLIIAAVLCCPLVHATTQIPDEIVIDERPSPLLTLPLNSIRPGIQGAVFLDQFFSSTCSANWRGHKAFWKIEDSRLFLIRVVTDACSGSTKEFPIETLFPGKSAPLLASWYSGSLLVAIGKPLRRGGLTPEYDRYLVITVADGVVLGSVEQDAPR